MKHHLQTILAICIICSTIGLSKANNTDSILLGENATDSQNKALDAEKQKSKALNDKLANVMKMIAEAKKGENQEKLEKEKAEKERQEKLEQERKEKEAAKKAKEIADKKARLDAERKAAIKAKQEADRQAAIKAKQEADRQAAIKAKQEADRQAAIKAKKEADRQAAIKAKKEADRQAAIKAKQEADRQAAIKAKQEADRQAAIKAKQEADRQAAIKAKQESDRQAAIKAKKEADRQAAIKAKQEADRQAAIKAKELAETKAREEAIRKAREESARKQKELQAKTAKALAQKKAKKIEEYKAKLLAKEKESEEREKKNEELALKKAQEEKEAEEAQEKKEQEIIRAKEEAVIKKNAEMLRKKLAEKVKKDLEKKKRLEAASKKQDELNKQLEQVKKQIQRQKELNRQKALETKKKQEALAKKVGEEKARENAAHEKLQKEFLIKQKALAREKQLETEKENKAREEAAKALAAKKAKEMIEQKKAQELSDNVQKAKLQKEQEAEKLKEKMAKERAAKLLAAKNQKELNEKLKQQKVSQEQQTKLLAEKRAKEIAAKLVQQEIVKQKQAKELAQKKYQELENKFKAEQNERMKQQKLLAQEKIKEDTNKLNNKQKFQEFEAKLKNEQQKNVVRVKQLKQQEADAKKKQFDTLKKAKEIAEELQQKNLAEDKKKGLLKEKALKDDALKIITEDQKARALERSAIINQSNNLRKKLHNEKMLRKREYAEIAKLKAEEKAKRQDLQKKTDVIQKELEAAKAKSNIEVQKLKQKEDQQKAVEKAKEQVKALEEKKINDLKNQLVKQKKDIEKKFQEKEEAKRLAKKKVAETAEQKLLKEQAAKKAAKLLAIKKEQGKLDIIKSAKEAKKLQQEKSAEEKRKVEEQKDKKQDDIKALIVKLKLKKEQVAQKEREKKTQENFKKQNIEQEAKQKENKTKKKKLEKQKRKLQKKIMKAKNLELNHKLNEIKKELKNKKIDEKHEFPEIIEDHDVSKMTNKQLLDHLSGLHQKKIDRTIGYLVKLRKLSKRQNLLDDTEKKVEEYQKTLKEITNAELTRGDEWSKDRKKIDNHNNQMDSQLEANPPKGGVTSLAQAKKFEKSTGLLIDKIRLEKIKLETRKKDLAKRLMIIRARIGNANVGNNHRLLVKLSYDRLGLYKKIANTLLHIESNNRHLYKASRNMHKIHKFRLKRNVKANDADINSMVTQMGKVKTEIKDLRDKQMNTATFHRANDKLQSKDQFLLNELQKKFDVATEEKKKLSYDLEYTNNAIIQYKSFIRKQLYVVKYLSQADNDLAKVADFKAKFLKEYTTEKQLYYMIDKNEINVDESLLKYKTHNLFKNIVEKLKNTNYKTDVTKLINPDEFDKQNLKYFDVKSYLDFLEKKAGDNSSEKTKVKAGKSTNASSSSKKTKDYISLDTNNFIIVADDGATVKDLPNSERILVTEQTKKESVSEEELELKRIRAKIIKEVKSWQKKKDELRREFTIENKWSVKHKKLWADQKGYGIQEDIKDITMLKKTLMIIYSQLTASNITRKLICDNYYDRNDSILNNQVEAFNRRKEIIRKVLAWKYKERVRSIMNGDVKKNQQQMNDIKFLRVETTDIDEAKKNRKLRYQVRYLEVRLMQLTLRSRYVHAMKQRAKFHVRIQQNAIDYAIYQLEQAAKIIDQNNNDKIAGQKKELKAKVTLLKDKKKTLKRLQVEIKLDINKGNLAKISINQKKIQTLNEQISKLQTVISIEKKPTKVSTTARKQIMFIQAHIASFKRLLEGFYNKAALKVIQYNEHNQDTIKKLQKAVMKHVSLEKLLIEGSSVSIQLPTIHGLEIPEGLYCDTSPQHFLDCFFDDWKVSKDTDHFYCQIYGQNRGKCVQIDKKGKILDNNSLVLNSVQDEIDRVLETDNTKVDCIDYLQATRRTCDSANLYNCATKWITYNPAIFKGKGNCVKKLNDMACINQTGTIFRKCATYNNRYWSCKAYSYSKATKKVSGKMIYSAYLRNYNDEYDVSKIGGNAKETYFEDEFDIEYQ